MSDISQKARSIFDAALALPETHDRAEYLKMACGEDGALRAHVDSLLGAYLEAGSFMENSPATDDDSSLFNDGISEQIGRYKLLQKIGEGGFGNVYMAEQQHPVVRKVALKIIKPGMDSKQVIARFEAERQALAMMDHPNIARVFDAGETDGGRPYFVMELVRGDSIIEYCDQQRLTVEQRLRLFLLVCGAIHHAHQKGIIHRDIKPSNVLVTLHDGRRYPK